MSRKHHPIRVTRGALGIRAQELRTLARTAWWARRWIAALEEMRLGSRFGRGRQYAVTGQVTELVIDGPHVEATVVGSREEPYSLSMDFTAATGAAQERIAAAICEEPMTLARLLTHDLPTEIEEIFRREDIPLFPQATPRGTSPEGRPIYDAKMHCSCPDWARPCKHLVAVLLLLGEEVAHRPETLLQLRGIDISTFTPSPLSTPHSPNPQHSPHPLQLSTLHSSLSTLHSSLFTLHSSLFTLHSSLLTRLGPVPFWRGRERCVDALSRLCNRMRSVAKDAAEGRSIDLRG